METLGCCYFHTGEYVRAREMHELAKVIKEELGDFAIALCCSQ